MKPARLAFLCAAACAFQATAADENAVVITGTRAEQPSLGLPMSIDRVYAEEIREGRPKVNLSESLGAVPGIVVQNRQNYAQDLQISSRGFGARATFGVRGIRLIADGVPATMPDGQGQASTFALGSAQRIEVLRGPFSSMYGNASGGVINVITEDGPAVPTLEGELSGGSYGAARGALKFGGQSGALNYIGEATRFTADGYRNHSAVTRDQANAKFNLRLGDSDALTLVANSLHQPDTQDPLGLTRAQVEANPRQATPQALQFNTRKSILQNQLGANYTHALAGGASVQASLYGGGRDIEQYLAIPLAQQAAPSSSGGVVDLDRSYGGAALRWFSAPGALRFSAGLEYDRQDEHRRGYVNNNGVAGALKRDEDNTVTSTDAYAQAEWRFAEAWSLHAGLRSSHVEFRSADHFIVPGNPDDSGKLNYSATTPVAGLLYRVSPGVSLYANAGQGFETPTAAELAYRNSGSGFNTSLKASHSNHFETGVKAVIPGIARVNAALFEVHTRDEIVVDVNSGGRTTFKNAGRTERKGVELSAGTLLAGNFEALAAYTYLDATYRDAFRSSGPPVVNVPAGNVLPGVPRNQFYAELRWRYAPAGFWAAAEAIYKDRVAVNDLNSEFASSFSVFNLAAGFTQEHGRWRLQEFLRVDNVGDRNYVGSVIVNEGNGRFYEPSPGRNYFAGVNARLQF